MSKFIQGFKNLITAKDLDVDQLKNLAEVYYDENTSDRKKLTFNNNLKSIKTRVLKSYILGLVLYLLLTTIAKATNHYIETILDLSYFSYTALTITSVISQLLAYVVILAFIYSGYINTRIYLYLLNIHRDSEPQDLNTKEGSKDEK